MASSAPPMSAARRPATAAQAGREKDDRDEARDHRHQPRLPGADAEFAKRGVLERREHRRDEHRIPVVGPPHAPERAVAGVVRPRAFVVPDDADAGDADLRRIGAQPERPQRRRGREDDEQPDEEGAARHVSFAAARPRTSSSRGRARSRRRARREAPALFRKNSAEFGSASPRCQSCFCRATSAGGSRFRSCCEAGDVVARSSGVELEHHRPAPEESRRAAPVTPRADAAAREAKHEDGVGRLGRLRHVANQLIGRDGVEFCRRKTAPGTPFARFCRERNRDRSGCSR